MPGSLSFHVYFKILLENINEIPVLCSVFDTSKWHFMEVNLVIRNLDYVQTRKKK
jgi:hypothetical protein